MARNRRKYTAEFKAEAVRLVRESGRSVSEIARDLGVRQELLGRWRTEVERAGIGGKAGAGKVRSPEEEIRRLEREVAILREEREILKKATVFFAKGAR
jgi:transposase